MMKLRAAAAFLSLALLCACSGRAAPPPETAPPDPHAGMVEVEDGSGGKIWVRHYEDLPANPLTREDFSEGSYTGAAFDVRRGVDVSEHQGMIDWAEAAASGVEFAVIRAGYRGYGQTGILCPDLFFRQNMEGAAANGIEVGVYFFSQAINAQEARTEAYYLLSLLSPYGPRALSLPVYYDWEEVPYDGSRTREIRGGVITECAVAFCEILAQAGYTPGIYAYRSLAYFDYELPRLKDYALWIGAVGDYPDFYYAHSLWQYSATGSVPGIATDVDLDLLFVPWAGA